MPDTKPRLVVLGTGFGAFNLVKHLKDDYIVTVISPRNHFLFTPLLPGTTVGTIESRSIIEPIRHARAGLRFYHASCKVLDAARNKVACSGVTDVGGNHALADLETFKDRGWVTWLFWRSAYLSRIVSVKNKVLVMFDWIKAKVFGRDISQF